MIGKTIRMYREFYGLNQIQLAQASGIPVGTIRKYETGIRTPKPSQLEKIANALGLNLSVFFDFHLQSAGDVMSLLFSIDDSIPIQFQGETDENGELIRGTIGIHFDMPALEDFLKEWADYKAALALANQEAMSESDPQLRARKLTQYAAIYERWKLKKMSEDSH